MSERWTFETELPAASGAFEVWRVRDADGRARLAKGVRGPADSPILKWLDREAELLSQLRHPRIPRILDRYCKDGRVWLICEEVVGPTLGERLLTTRMTVSEVLDRVIQILAIVADLHALAPPVIHRDLTPDRFVEAPDGICLTDFTSALASPGGGGNTMFGSPGYIAPEQLAGSPSPASDVYAVGAIALRMLTHQEPAELLRRGRLTWPENIQIAAPLREWIDATTARESESRPSARDALLQLRRLRRELRADAKPKADLLPMGVPLVPTEPPPAKPAEPPKPAAPPVAMAPPPDPPRLPEPEPTPALPEAPARLPDPPPYEDPPARSSGRLVAAAALLGAGVALLVSLPIGVGIGVGAAHQLSRPAPEPAVAPIAEPSPPGSGLQPVTLPLVKPEGETPEAIAPEPPAPVAEPEAPPAAPVSPAAAIAPEPLPPLTPDGAVLFVPPEPSPYLKMRRGETGHLYANSPGLRACWAARHARDPQTPIGLITFTTVAPNRDRQRVTAGEGADGWAEMAACMQDAIDRERLPTELVHLHGDRDTMFPRPAVATLDEWGKAFARDPGARACAAAWRADRPQAPTKGAVNFRFVRTDRFEVWTTPPAGVTEDRTRLGVCLGEAAGAWFVANPDTMPGEHAVTDLLPRLLAPR